MEILAGFLIALAIGITGVGAGSITAPILILFFHQSATDAVTTALVFGTVVKLIATPIYLSRGHVNFRVLKFMASGRAAGGGDREPRVELAGSESHEPTGPRDRRAYGFDYGWRHALAQPDAEDSGETGGFEVAALDRGADRFRGGVLIGGAGALGTIVLMRYTSLVAAEVVGTDIAFGLLLSIFAGGIHASMSGVPWAMLWKLLLGGVPAVLIGTQLVSVFLRARCGWRCVSGWYISAGNYRGGELRARRMRNPLRR